MVTNNILIKSCIKINTSKGCIIDLDFENKNIIIDSKYVQKQNINDYGRNRLFWQCCLGQIFKF